jgi:hypothetical protein
MDNVDAARRELVARKARRYFKNISVHLTVRTIHGVWGDEDFSPAPEDPFTLETGERRCLYERYLNAVDWTNAGDVRRALRVFWQTRYELPVDLIFSDDDETGFQMLERQGYKFDDDGNPSGGPFRTGFREELFRGVKAPQVLKDHLGRMEKAATEEDPALVIGSAKELLESTAKIVLSERGMTIERDNENLPYLIKQSQIALGVHASGVASGPDGEQSVRKILSGLSAAANGLSELRNAGYGTGHGPAETKGGLHERHAHLAATTAKAWSEFMLATLADEKAPWRKAAEDESAGDRA